MHVHTDGDQTVSQWIIHTNSSWIDYGRELRIARRREDGGVDVLTNLTFVSVPPGHQGPEYQPVIPHRDADSFLRAIMNAAWEAGIRPDGFLDARESMKATTAHLEDMRAIAFHKVGAPKP